MDARAKDIFDEARRLACDEQEAYVRGRCGEDAALAGDVLVLLKDLEAAGGFLNVPASGPGAASGVDGVGPREGPGCVIDRYRLLELIGEGGVGSVFLAEQREPVRRTVALKIIKPGMDTRQVIARFGQERQALALMDHPNIAKVFDAGATETGRPYFVMELVRGEPITPYCDAHRLGMRERLEVFVQVCHAVQHAHQKGIIHRDLKPSNILVTSADGRPVPKVIDFGIAKATGPRLIDMTVYTEHRALIGTPEYMSPEQAEMGGVDIDTRTDIYSLGVLLYELLTGVTPFDPKRLRSAAWGELQRIIREVEPPRPSTRLSAMAEKLAEIAIRRDTQPEKLRGLIRGDLDWIVMKAIEKDRSRRYETANGLAMDIARHLAGESVLAAPPGTAYRVRKFVKRNRVPVTAAALVALVALFGLLGTSVALVIARDQRDRAVGAEGRERQRATEARRAAAEAEDQARRAKIALGLMDSGLGFANPARPGGANLEVRRMLELLEQSIPVWFAGRPKEQIQARVTLGQRLLRIDDSLGADIQMRKAIDLMQRSGEPDPLLLFEARSALYTCASAGVHGYTLYGREMAAAAAVAYLRQASPALGNAAAEYVESTMAADDGPAAARTGRALLKAAEAFPGMTSAQAWALTDVLHLPCPESSRPDKARACVPILLEWLGTAERLGVDENTLLDYRHTVLKLCLIRGGPDLPVSVARDQLQATGRLLAADPWQRMRFDSCAAHLLVEAGETAEGRQILIDVARKARLSQSVNNFAARMNNLAARVLWHHVLAVSDKLTDPKLITDAFGPMDAELVAALSEVPERPPSVWVWNNTDWARRVIKLVSSQSVTEAGTRRVLGAALAMPSASKEPDDPYSLRRFVEFLEPGEAPPTVTYAQGLFALAKSESELGDWEKARGTYARGVDCFTKIFGEDAWFIAKGRFQIGNCSAVLGDPANGLAQMHDNLQRVRDRFGAVDPVTLDLEHEYYARLLECGQRQEAGELLKRILPQLQTAPPPTLNYVSPLLRAAALHPDLDVSVLSTAGTLAHDGAALGRLDPAESLMIELVVLLKQNKEPAASALACERLRAVLEASSPSEYDLMSTGWWVASVAGLSPEVYRLVDDCARKVEILDPKNLDLYDQQLCGMAALRRGRFEEAVSRVSAADLEWREKTGRGLPVSAAVRACAFAQLGRWQEARVNLRDARTWARDRVYTTPLIREAEELIGDH